MEIESIALLRYNANWNGHPVFTQPYHLLLFLDSGSCTYHVNEMQYTMRAGDALFVSAGSIRSGNRSSSEHAKYAIRWNGDTIHRYFPYLGQRASLFQASSLSSYLRTSFSQLHRLWQEKEMYYEPLCCGLMLELLARIHRDGELHNKTGKQTAFVKEVRQYIHAHFNEPLCIEELARLVNRSPSHLMTSFKKHYGAAPLAYMHRVRISRAEELLLQTDATMETIAEELGYCDAPYFNRMFKKVTGLTPSAYRKQM